MKNPLLRFGNALREVLGLDPLYLDGHGRQRPGADDAARFHRDAYVWGELGRVDTRKRASRGDR